MSFFFILSGFLLTWARSADQGVTTFYRRRLARIIPLHAATWALVVVLASGGLLDAGSRRGQAYALVLVQSWSPIYVSAGNKVSWSLSCELLFYAVFPVVVVALARTTARLQWMILAICGVLAIGVLPAIVPNDFWVYNFPGARLIEFIAGACLASRFREGWRCPVTLPAAGALFAVAIVFSNLAPSAAKPVAVTAVPIALLISTAATRELNGRSGILVRPWLVRLGVWSFALYLIHNIAVELVLHFTGYLEIGGLLVVAPSIIVGSLGLSFLAYRYVESPAERRLRTWSRGPQVRMGDV